MESQENVSQPISAGMIGSLHSYPWNVPDRDHQMRLRYTIARSVSGVSMPRKSKSPSSAHPSIAHIADIWRAGQNTIREYSFDYG